MPSLAGTLTGPLSGGEQITILAPGLAMTSEQDSFLDGSIDAGLWDTNTTGSGYIIEIPDEQAGAVLLATGKTADSSAILRRQSAYLYFDVSLEASFGLIDIRTSDAEGSLWLGAYVSSTTYLRVALVVTRSSALVRVTKVVGGLTETFEIDGVGTIRGANLRLLRTPQKTVVFLNKSEILSTRWSSSVAYPELGVSNGSDPQASIMASIRYFDMTPVVLFGEQPVKKVLFKSDERMDVVTPSQEVPGEVSVRVETTTSSIDIDDSYTYESVTDPLLIAGGASRSLSFVSDPVVHT